MKYFSPAILDGSVTSASLADNSVTLAKMADDAIRKAEIDTATTGQSGTLGALAVIGILLPDYCFFPMIHGSDGTDIRLTGHQTDGDGGAFPRFAFYNSSGSALSYDVDYRYVV